MPIFKASKIPKKNIDAEETLAIFCYHFPQYTFQEARKLPFMRVRKMLDAARKEQAKSMIDFLRVVAAPHSKNGAKSVLSYFQKIIEE